MDEDSDRYLQPLQVISYFLENGGKATNIELVKHFKTFLSKSEIGQENAAYLKRKKSHLQISLHFYLALINYIYTNVFYFIFFLVQLNVKRPFFKSWGPQK